MREAPLEADLFCIEGEILRHAAVQQELARRLRAGTSSPWCRRPPEPLSPRAALQDPRWRRQPRTTIRPDALAAGSTAALERRAAAMLARIGAPGELPKWPAAEVQAQLHRRARAPLDARRARASSRRSSGPVRSPTRAGSGLDYGCGWGRIASVLLTKGGPDQLDLCDAWPPTIDILRDAGFPNRVFTVSEVLKAGEIPAAAYDFAYAFSVFTHLRRDVFENNLADAAGGAEAGRALYFTVRHADYMRRVQGEAGGLRGAGARRVLVPSDRQQRVLRHRRDRAGVARAPAGDGRARLPRRGRSLPAPLRASPVATDRGAALSVAIGINDGRTFGTINI